MNKSDLLNKFKVFKKQPKHISFKPYVIVLISLIGLAAVIITFIFIINANYQGKVFIGTKIGSFDISGMTRAELEKLIEEESNKIIDQGLTLKYQDEQFNVKSFIGDPANPELSAPLFTFNSKETADKIFKQNTQHSEAERIFYWLTGWRPSPVYELNSEKIISALKEELGQYEQPAQEANLVVADDFSISITPEKAGQTFDYQAVLNRIKENFNRLSNFEITVELKPDIPAITKQKAESLVGLTQQVLDSAPFKLIHHDQSWEISKEQLADWLEFQTEGQWVQVGLKSRGFATYLEEIALKINVEVREAKFSMRDGRVTEFQPSREGVKLLISETIDQVNRKIVQVGMKEIDLVVDTVKPTTTTDDVNQMGIRELVGEGTSNFKGSPKNRRHNIATGADKLNGILIKPDEEFSLVRALGAIEASTGYLPELVIKGNKTIPEYGGGLCQIGTTTFRAALDAGLPITERKNHSYRVSYYEPAGTDATIYDPKPDFKFINDTGYHLLLTTTIEGDSLIFRLYGTADGRQVEQTKPRIFNQVKPGPTRLIETTDLKPGEKKCIEKSHTGADTEFSRTVIMPDGTKKVDVFKSHYKPWQEVCLIGVEKTN